MIDWRDELRHLLESHEYESRSLPGSKRRLMEHHVSALMDDLVPFIEERFAPPWTGTVAEDVEMLRERHEKCLRLMRGVEWHPGSTEEVVLAILEGEDDGEARVPELEGAKDGEP